MLASMTPRPLVSPLVLATFFTCVSSLAQTSTSNIEAKGAAHTANANGIYAALRTDAPTGDGISVENFTLQREGATFHFIKGSFYFYAPVNGRITGAVFLGSGHFDLAPKEAAEQHSLAFLTKGGPLSQDFNTLVLRFTDTTADEVRKASAGSVNSSQATQASHAAHDLSEDFRRQIHENLDLRLLSDVLRSGDASGGFFLASFRTSGTPGSHNALFTVDPDDNPDQVSLATRDDDSYQVWVGYKMASRTASAAKTPAILHVSAQKLDVIIEKSGVLHNNAETTFTVSNDGRRVIPLHIFPTLRVEGVYAEDGTPLDFIQEGKDDDPQFALILAQPSKAGESRRVLIRYGGKDALQHEGEGVYYLRPDARESWYPSGPEDLGGFASYEMTFHLPKGLQIVATGKEVSHAAEAGGGTRSVWASGNTPIAVAGFNLGNFKSVSSKTPQDFQISAYANVNPPDSVASMDNSGMGSLSGTAMLNSELAEGNAAIQVYTDYFGKLPFDHVSLTEQSVCSFGQSWPTLVYLPFCAFWDDTQKNAFGLLSFGGSSYWRDVTAHEIAHQWWGQLVGFDSYRDQWMSEGFATFSTSVYLMQTRKNMDDYRAFWNEQHKLLLEKSTTGKRPIDVGPLTMGERVANEKTGNVYQSLIYSKGAYVLHMLELMYWTPKYQEEPFKKAMQFFVSQYAGKAASTEDFKHSMERNLPPWIDVDQNGKLDWFFNEYVYGTELPHYALTFDFKATDGATDVHFKLAQSNVSKDFVMLVPLYVQLENGHVSRIGSAKVIGDSVIDQTVNLGKLPSPAKKLLLNYNADVLSE